MSRRPAVDGLAALEALRGLYGSKPPQELCDEVERPEVLGDALPWDPDEEAPQ